MKKYQQFIDFAANLPCIYSEVYRISKKSKYHSLRSRLTYNILGSSYTNFIMFFEDALVLRMYQKDKDKYSDLVQETMHMRWEIDKDTSNWYEIPLSKINKSNESIIYELIKKSYDNLYEKYEQQFALNFNKEYFEGKFEGEEIMKLAIKHRNAEKYAYILDKVKKKAVRLIENPDKEIKKGSSKLGGQPDLPVGFEWPLCDGKPLTFLAQIDLSEVDPEKSGYRLPEKGFLYLFSGVANLEYEEYAYFLDKIDEPKTNKVYYFDVDKKQLKRQNNYYSKLNEVPVDIDYIWSYPLYTEEKVFEEFNLSEDELELLTDLSDIYFTAVNSSITMQYLSLHLLFAYEMAVQELHSVDMVLFQTTSSEGTGMYWGDSGIFFYHIKDEDLKNLNFDNIKVSTDCS